MNIKFLQDIDDRCELYLVEGDTIVKETISSQRVIFHRVNKRGNWVNQGEYNPALKKWDSKPPSRKMQSNLEKAFELI